RRVLFRSIVTRSSSTTNSYPSAPSSASSPALVRRITSLPPDPVALSTGNAKPVAGRSIAARYLATSAEPSIPGSEIIRVSVVRKKVLPDAVAVTGRGITPSNRNAASGLVGCDGLQEKKLKESEIG